MKERKAFNCLVAVKDLSSNLIADYRYNGLGWRISWHDDVDSSGTVTTADPQFHAFYDPTWRMVATQRWAWSSSVYVPDSYLKETFLFHGAGAGGAGNPDNLIRRDRNTSA